MSLTSQLVRRRAAPRSLSRLSWLLAPALALVPALLVEWQVVRLAVAWRLTGTKPAVARAWGGDRSEILLRLVQQQIGRADTPAALAAVDKVARAALIASPLDARAVRVVAVLLALEGHAPRADALMELAAEHSRRDYISQIWLFDLRQRQGRYGEAIDAADAILRHTPEAGAGLYPVIAEAAMRPAFAAALAARLAQGPPWRADLFAAFRRPGLSSAGAQATIAALAATAAPATADEMAPLIARTADAGNLSDAHALWLLASGMAPDHGWPVDAGFAGSPAPPPFNWSLVDTDEASFALQEGNPVLAVGYEGRGGRKPLARQLVLLPPGSYRFSVRTRGEAGGQPRWTITCNGARQPLATLNEAIGTEWRRFGVRFAVPAAGCPGQWLQLSATPSAGGTRVVPMFFDDAQIGGDAPVAPGGSGG